MIVWLRRNRSDENGGPRWSADPDPTPDERRDELLSAYIDDELTPAERAELEARLATDAPLRASLEGLQVVRDTLATLEVVRAPRSFAITAPAARTPRGVFGRLDLLARVGTMTAAVAFVAVLAGDLSSGGGTPIVEQDFAASAAIDDGAADLGAAAATGATDGASTPDAAASRASDADQPPVTESAAADDAATPAPTAEALAADEEPTVTAAAATAAVSSSEEPAAPPADAASDALEDGGAAASAGADASDDAAPAPLPPNSGGAIEPPVDATTDAATENNSGSAEPGTPAQDLPQLPAAAGDVERVSGDEDTGTVDAESALSLQPDTFAATSDEARANLLVEDDGEPSGLAIGLGVVTGLLAAVSGLLWWRRRDGAAGPV